MLSEPVKFLLSVSPSNEMGNRQRQRKKVKPIRESNPRPPGLIIHCSTDLVLARSQIGTSLMIIVVNCGNVNVKR